MRTIGVAAVLFVAAFGSATAEAPLPTIDVRAVRVEFAGPRASNDVLVARLSFAADSLPAFDAAKDDVELRVGASDAFRVGPGVASNVRVRGKVVTYGPARRGAPGTESPFRLLVLDLRRGRLRARVDRAGAFALRGASTWDVPVTLRIGAAGFATSADFGVTRGGRVRSAPAAPDPTIHLVPENVRWYDNSSIWDPRTLVVSDSTAWTALWAEHVASNFPHDPVPAVDFTHDVIVAVFRQGTAISLTVDGFETRADRIVAHFTVAWPGPHCVVEAAVDHLYAFVRIPRPTLPIEFDERVIVVDCLP
jgi:hypothetical protein